MAASSLSRSTSERPLEPLMAKSLPHHSFPKDKIKILLLENIDQDAAEYLRSDGFTVVQVKGALSEDELVEQIPAYSFLGIRSKTQVTARVVAAAKRLLGVGCFCIGTNQVDLEATRRAGIPVWNSPFCNSRSVAELMVCQIIGLSRQIGDRNKEMHRGHWGKKSKGCYEIRGKTLGIIGYGHIGTQLSVLAEAMGMKVIFYDILTIMPLGNAHVAATLDELLGKADFVTLHVPATPETENMIDAPQLALMRKGSFLLNASRGNVVNLAALAAALREGHIAGAYLDVYPEEPQDNGDGLAYPWWQELHDLPNVILSPHIGGSTEEAQRAIGAEVSRCIARFINEGRTMGAVNFPNLDVPVYPNCHRLLVIHENVPGYLKRLNSSLSDFNIFRQSLESIAETAYLILDIDKDASNDVLNNVQTLEGNIRVRVLYM